LSPPIPVTAVWSAGVLTVNFDRPLQPGELIASNWFIRIDGASYGITFVEAVGNSVRLNAEQGEDDPGPDVVSYSAATPDVLSLAGIPAAAFTDFPIT
jgi:hypothetical protein